MLAEQVDYVIGVDTHRDEHAVAIVDAHSGAVIAQTMVAAPGIATPIDLLNRSLRHPGTWRSHLNDAPAAQNV